jgi:hypothetical protein
MSESAAAGLTGYMWMERGITTAPCGAERGSKMNIEKLKSVIEVVKLMDGEQPLSETPEHTYKIGEQCLVMTVTHYYTGKLERVTPGELVLSTAAWICDTGRLHDALKTGVLNEVEPIPGNVIIGRGAIVSVLEWPHTLPTEQK